VSILAFLQPIQISGIHWAGGESASEMVDIIHLP
jgi:hypothetical protein